VDDLADACLLLMRQYEGEHWINVGSGQEVSIAGLAALVAKAVGYEGMLRFDPSMPDGTPRKLLDSAKLAALGWLPRIGLDVGIESTYRWFIEHRDSLRS
jgi:GDP-L-fucose synthase